MNSIVPLTRGVSVTNQFITTMKNVNRGGGYINELSRAKAKLIKTPLKFHTEWNAKVNACESIEELEYLDVRLTERKYLFVLDFTSGDCLRYDYCINKAIGVDTEDVENFLTENGHKVDDCEWMLTKNCETTLRSTIY